MTICPQWKSMHPVAQFVGSGGPSLGFYHVDVPAVETTQWLNFTNCGVVKVLSGEVDIAEMEKELSAIFCKEWPWKIRELDRGQFLVRFPPHKKVSDIKNYPSFNLRKEGVRVEVLEWFGKVDPFEELQEVWVEVSGIPPKWCAWLVFAQITSTFGLMIDVEWSSLFKSFYEKVRIKVACRDPSKIPIERLFDMNKQLYKVYFYAEEVDQDIGGEDGDDDNGHGGDDDNDKEFDGLDDEPGDKGMEIDKFQDKEAPRKSPPPGNSSEKPISVTKGSRTVGLQVNQEPEVECFLEGAVHFNEKNPEEELVTPEWVNNHEESEIEKSKWMQLIQLEGEMSASRCAQLLRDMELCQSESEDEEDKEGSKMDKMLVDQLSAKRNLISDLEQCAEEEREMLEKHKKEKKWGPILPCRKSSRIVDDGRKVVEKTEDQAKIRNLEKPAKHGEEMVEDAGAGKDGGKDTKALDVDRQEGTRGKTGANRLRMGQEGGDEVCTYNSRMVDEPPPQGWRLAYSA